VLETASKKLSAEVVTVSLATSHAYSTSSVTALSTTSGLPLATSTTRGPSTCSLRRPSPTPSFDGGGAGGIEDLDPGAELQGGPASTLAQAPNIGIDRSTASTIQLPRRCNSASLAQGRHPPGLCCSSAHCVRLLPRTAAGGRTAPPWLPPSCFSISGFWRRRPGLEARPQEHEASLESGLACLTETGVDREQINFFKTFPFRINFLLNFLMAV
jgi:hypothetical protein